jgi:hypothetical protein
LNYKEMVEKWDMREWGDGRENEENNESYIFWK